MRVIELGGGLGDVFLDIFNTNAYTQLDTLPPSERAQVVLRSANPWIGDLFKWHPLASRLSVIEIGSGDPWGKEQRDHYGIGEPSKRTPRNGAPVNFYPSMEDRILIQSIPRPYVVFALSAGVPSVNIPANVAEEAADVVCGKNIPVVTVGRNYLNVIRNFKDGTYGTIPREEVRVKPRPGLVDTVDRLSIPGLATLVHGAAATFCCHSSTMILSWLLRKPVFALYHEMKKNEWEGAFSTTMGKDYPETKALCLNDWRSIIFDEFVNRYVRWSP